MLLSTTRRGQDPKLSEEQTINLFFGALFRLGVWTGDWETWYGTRPLAPWIRTRRPAVRPPVETTRDRPAR